MNRSRLLVRPRDGLFLKDGRGWYTSDVGRSHGRSWPLPPTVRGALRAAYGHTWMAQTREHLRPQAWERASRALSLRALIALRIPRDQDPVPAHRLWPCPADASYRLLDNPERTNDLRDLVCSHLPPRIVRLDPKPAHPDVTHLEAADARADAPMRWSALWRPYVDTGKPAPSPEFWTDDAMMRWLRGDHVDSEPGLSVPRRTDVHVTLDRVTETATPSMLFSTEITEPVERTGDPEKGHQFAHWCLALDCDLPGGTDALPEPSQFPGGPLTIGGRRRLSPVARAPDILFEPPADLGGDSPGLRVILATPAEFEHGWLPDGFACRGDPPVYVGKLAGIADPVILRAAIVHRPLDLSTWDMVERCPRRTRRLVRAGSVYFFHKQNREVFTPDERRELWLAALGRHPEDGLGQILPGRWNTRPPNSKDA